MVAMQLALLTDDFSLAYVANHHSSNTPFPFDVATAWAALEAQSSCGDWSLPSLPGWWRGGHSTDWEQQQLQ